MSSYDDLIHTSASLENQELAEEAPAKPKRFLDYLSLALTTFGVGYVPLAPGTWGSAVGVLIYLLFRRIEFYSAGYFANQNWQGEQVSAWIHVLNAVLLLLFSFAGIWAANRATVLFRDKDPQQAVVDEVIGQLITFLFVPFAISGWLIFAGFLLFRLFDVWKPYPINSLQNLPAGLGVCADDILAGAYAGICLAAIYAVNLTV